MSYRKITATLLVVLSFLGVGCAKKPSANSSTTGASSNMSGPVQPEIEGRVVAEAPADAWLEYQQASAMPDVRTATQRDEKNARVMSYTLPAGGDIDPVRWSGETTSTYVRVGYFTGMGAAGQWAKQQEQTDVHQVVHTQQDGDSYLLLVNHPQIKSSLLKVFQTDPERPDDGYYFMECRVPFSGVDRAQAWRACKTTTSIPVTAEVIP